MRKARILKDGGVYHVTAKANREEMVMAEASMKQLFVTTIEDAKKKYSFRLDNYCIMGNHFHLLIKPLNGESLSMIMQWILGVFAMRWNRKNHLTGHLWGERFFSRLIERMKDYLSVFAYIDENPVTAKLVAHAADWPFGALWGFQRSIPGIADMASAWLLRLLPSRRKSPPR